jgi:hypothetical protein
LHLWIWFRQTNWDMLGQEEEKRQDEQPQSADMLADLLLALQLFPLPALRSLSLQLRLNQRCRDTLWRLLRSAIPNLFHLEAPNAINVHDPCLVQHKQRRAGEVAQAS